MEFLGSPVLTNILLLVVILFLYSGFTDVKHRMELIDGGIDLARDHLPG